VTQDISRLKLAEAASLVARGEVSPVQLVDAALERIQEHQERLNAFITVFPEEARQQARVLQEELLKGSRGPLHGIPVALKDLYYTREGPTTAGSKILAGFRPGYDSTVAERLRRSGAIITGKTNTHEFAFGPTTENSHFGPTRNPWDPSRISGGSSGGSAVAVATGMSYMAMGTDTGGSVRIPASLCGVVGFKPTLGRVSLSGVIPLSCSFDHAGPLARSVRDTALAMDAIAGLDPRDPRTWGEQLAFEEALAPAGDMPLAGLTVGVPANFYFDKVEPEIETLVRAAIETLGDLGARLREVTIPGLDDVPRITSTLMYAEAAHYHRENLAVRPGDYEPDVLGRLEAGLRVTAVEYIEALREMERVRASFDEAMNEVSVLAMPTLPVPAYPIGSKTIQVRGLEEPAREMLVRHTRLGNLTGGPALSVPCGFTGEGLPAGLQVMGRRGDDLTVLRVGHFYEEGRPLDRVMAG
jgi:aspartyl-tRNA(Asn)/glutamyl-tRNA(Gln) amidotransferase subunit A